MIGITNVFKCVWTNISSTFISPKIKPISGTKLRNFLINDPILDWLNMYGESKGYVKNPDDYTEYIMNRGNKFEDYVINYLRDKVSVTEITGNNEVEKTKIAMREGHCIIYQGHILCEELELMGIPDLLIRGDILQDLFNILPGNSIEIHSGNMEYPYLYYVVDIKFASIYLGKNGVLNKGSMRAYKGQLYIYNKILQNLFYGYREIETKFEQPYAFLLGRRLVDVNILDGKENLALIDLNSEKLRIREAINWIKELRKDGANWDPLDPKREEMCPNMKNQMDSPWRNVKKYIADQIDEPTQYWGINRKVREKGIELYMSELKEKKRKTVEDIIEVNSDSEEEFVCRIPQITKDNLRKSLSNDVMNFYVDFEFLNGNDISFDYDTRTHLYMIGMGYEENGKFVYKSFIPRKLTLQEEKLNIYSWLSSMRFIARRMGKEFRIIHWTRAEPQLFMRLKEVFNFRGNLEWFDLHPVFRDNQIICKGMHNFSLKSVVKSLKTRGMLDLCWQEEVGDGLGANMVIIKNKENGNEHISTYEGINDVLIYNKVDCEALFELVKFIRFQLQ